MMTIQRGLELKAIESIKRLDSMFYNEFCKIDLQEQESIINNIHAELEKLKDTLQQNKIDAMQRQGNQEHIKLNDSFCIELWHENDFYTIGTGTSDYNKALKMAEFMLKSTGFKNANIFNSNKSYNVKI